MTTLVSATPRPQAQQARPESSGCSPAVLGVVLIVCGLLFGWVGYNKGVEYFYDRLHDPDAAIEAEMRYLQRRMDCLPGEVLEITPLGNHGAKSVRCVPGGNMPRREEPRG